VEAVPQLDWIEAERGGGYRGGPTGGKPMPAGPPAASPPGGTAAPRQQDRQPEQTTRTAYARLDAPQTVTAGQEFAVLVGLAPSPSAGVLQPSPLTVPTVAFTLTVQLLVDGFTRVGGGGSTVDIAVDPLDPYPYALVRLVADDRDDLPPARTLLAVYAVDGHTLGVATRSVQVLSAGDPAASADAEPGAFDAPGDDWALPAGADDPDLTVVIAAGDSGAGRNLLWSIRSPHAAVPTPRDPVETTLDSGVSSWVRRVMEGVEARKGAADLRYYLRGIARIVADAAPEELWVALRAAARIRSRPTLLLCTSEPYVPWELAAVPDRWDGEAPPYLGAQASVGRWIYREQGRTPVPPSHVDARSMVVVKGQYAGSRRLAEAEAEAEDLRAAYGATVVRAELNAVLGCLTGQPRAEVVHFAVHGRFDPSGLRAGILMDDIETTLDPVSVYGVEESPVRVVFLNACQLGQGETMLGDYAGMVAAFLRMGATAVIAPLWKVDDTVARGVATRFFAAVLAGQHPSDVLADERRAAAIGAGEGSADGTRLAYLFFGHPRLRLGWTPGG
jgi:hypothetical protein